MTRALDTSHPLYGNVVEVIGVENGELKSLKTARTFTKDADASFVTAGNYGEAFRTVGGGYNRKGATFTPAVGIDTYVYPGMSVLVVVNNITPTGGNGTRTVVGGTGLRVGISSAGKMMLAPGDHVGTTTISGGAHSLLAVREGEAAGSKGYVDGVHEITGGNLGWNSTSTQWFQIGGEDGIASVGADVVWIAFFNKALTAEEAAELHASLAGGQTFGLVTGATGGAATVSNVTVNPSAPNVTGGTTQQFTATVAGTNNPGQGVTWSLSPTVAGASINSSGVFTAPAATASVQTFTITATSTVDNTKSGTATASVPATGAPPVTYTGVAVSPSTATVTGLATQQFSATVSGTGAFSTAVTWTVDGTGNGTINSSGLYTAPAAGVSARNVVVRATAANGTTTGTAAVTVPAATGAGSFVTEAMVNNTGQVVANTSIRWSWFPGGRIGAFTGITPVEGVATTNAQGQLTATGLATGAGLLVAAQWINGATDDVVFYQAGTVA